MAVKENIYEYLKEIELKANNDIKNNYIGYENYKVKTVKHYNKDVELINKEIGKKELIDLAIAELENPDNPNEIRILYYLNGEEVNYADLLKIYETDEPIRDVINKSKENKKKPEKEQDKELQMQDLEEEEKKEKEKKGVNKEELKDKKEDKKKDDKQISRKPKYIIQTIDLDDAYLDNVETIHRAFRLPSNVKQLAFAYSNKEDKQEFGSGVTIYMLDAKGNIVGSPNDKQYFRVDDATGKNPTYDNNTELELDKTGERHSGKTMRRFRSVKRPDMYLSVKQKKVGQYNEIYADRKKESENASIGNQVATRNVEIQTSLEMQTINSTYKGVYHPDDIDKETDKHEEHGDDIDNIAKENLDGLEYTKATCEKNIYLLYECVAELKENDEFVRENFSDESVIKTLIFNIDKNPSITREGLMQETSDMFHNTKIYQEDKNKESSIIKQTEEKEIEEEYEGRVPWDRTQH